MDVGGFTLLRQQSHELSHFIWSQNIQANHSFPERDASICQAKSNMSQITSNRVGQRLETNS